MYGHVQREGVMKGIYQWKASLCWPRLETDGFTLSATIRKTWLMNRISKFTNREEGFHKWIV